MASAKVDLCRLPGLRPSSMSRASVLNGLDSPLCVERMWTSPPQMRNAIAALSTAARSSTKAASSTTALSPGRPFDRNPRGADVIATISLPEASGNLKAGILSFSSSSMSVSPTASAPIWRAWAQPAQSLMKPRVMSRAYDW